MTKAENSQFPVTEGWTLRDHFKNDFLSAHEHALNSPNYGETLLANLIADADLREKILRSQKHPLISRRLVLGYLPQQARAIVCQYFDTLFLGKPGVNELPTLTV